MAPRGMALALVCVLALTANLAMAQTCTQTTPALADLQSTAGTDGFSLFYQALVATDAVKLNATSTLTFLAPADAAFTAGLTSLGLPTTPSAWTAAQKKLVRGVLLYHILPGQPGKFLNRTNTASLNKTLASLVDTFICGPGSVTIPLNDTDPIDNINSVNLDFTSNSTIKVNGLFSSANASATEYTDACFPSLSIYVLDGVILPCDPTSPCALSATLIDVLTKAGMPLAAPALANVIPEQMVNGTVLLPTDAAVNATVAAANAAFKAAGMAAMTAEQIFAMPQMADLFYYHIIPNVNLGPSPAPGTYTTLLKGMKQSYCKLAPPATVVIGAGGTTVKDAADTVGNITVRVEKACNGVIYNIDTILVPCATKDSALASLLPGATSPKASPKASPSPAIGASPSGPAAPPPSPPNAGSARQPMMLPATVAALLLALALLLSN